VKETFKALWLNHKKKIVAIAIAILSALGLLNADLREAIHEATAPKIEAPAPAPTPAPEASKVEQAK
jgi:hypothetical protein